MVVLQTWEKLILIGLFFLGVSAVVKLDEISSREVPSTEATFPCR